MQALDDIRIALYRQFGHLTVPDVFDEPTMQSIIADIETWGESFLAGLSDKEKAWYIDGGVTARTVLRKLDNPHAHRDAVMALARDPALVGLVESLIGPRCQRVLQPDLLQAARGRWPQARPSGQLLLRPLATRRRGHGLDCT